MDDTTQPSPASAVPTTPPSMDQLRKILEGMKRAGVQSVRMEGEGRVAAITLNVTTQNIPEAAADKWYALLAVRAMVGQNIVAGTAGQRAPRSRTEPWTLFIPNYDANLLRALVASAKPEDVLTRITAILEQGRDAGTPLLPMMEPAHPPAPEQTATLTPPPALAAGAGSPQKLSKRSGR